MSPNSLSTAHTPACGTYHTKLAGPGACVGNSYIICITIRYTKRATHAPAPKVTTHGRGLHTTLAFSTRLTQNGVYHTFVSYSTCASYHTCVSHANVCAVPSVHRDREASTNRSAEDHSPNKPPFGSHPTTTSILRNAAKQYTTTRTKAYRPFAAQQHHATQHNSPPARQRTQLSVKCLSTSSRMVAVSFCSTLGEQ